MLLLLTSPQDHCSLFLRLTNWCLYSLLYIKISFKITRTLVSPSNFSRDIWGFFHFFLCLLSCLFVVWFLSQEAPVESVVPWFTAGQGEVLVARMVREFKDEILELLMIRRNSSPKLTLYMRAKKWQIWCKFLKPILWRMGFFTRQMNTSILRQTSIRTV